MAAGSSARMGGIDKMFAPLDGQPVLARVVGVFEKAPSVDRVAVVLNEHNIERGRKLAEAENWQKVDAILPGGALRQDSVKQGLMKLPGCEWIIIHDGARPLVTVELIEAGLGAALETGAAVCAVPAADTIKEEKDGFVAATLNREKLKIVQTPQVFRAGIIKEAYDTVSGSVTDDSSLVEKLGYRVKFYPGSYENLKITTPADLVMAEVIWRRRSC